MVRVHRCSQSGVYWLLFGEDAIPGTSSGSIFYRSDHHDLPPEIINGTDSPKQSFYSLSTTFHFNEDSTTSSYISIDLNSTSHHNYHILNRVFDIFSIHDFYLINRMSTDSVAPKKIQLKRKSVHFAEIPQKISLDKFLVKQLGNFGRYQLLQFFLVCLPSIFVSMHVMSWTFVAFPSEMVCANETTSENCTKVGYSAVDRWNLQGDRSWIKATIQSLYYIGQMTGSLFCGIMSDKIGRKKVFYIAILTQISCGILLTVAPTWWIFAALKCGTGFSHPGIYTVCIVLGTELLGTKYRKLASVGGATFGAIGELILVGMASLIVDYRILHAAIVLPSLVFLSYWWLVPESIRWLVAKDRYEEASSILHKAARLNRKSIPDRWWEQLEIDRNSTCTSTRLFDLIRTPRMRSRTLVCFFLWPVNSMMYYGLTMKSNLGGGSLYINFAISAAVEIPAIFVVFLLIDRIGRRWIVAISLSIAGLCLVLNWIIGDNVPFGWGMLQIAITKGAVTVSYTALYTYTSELFPTVIRNTAVGCCSTFARIGSIASSYLALWLVDAYGKLSMVIPFSLLALTAAILTTAILPETMSRPIPETIFDVESCKNTLPEVEFHSYPKKQRRSFAYTL
ncbi:hypothetical protein Y032_0149g2715 [Ancylostoma ceylanicum]|uniref:Major facilitator superfamily (MFS) profile domain-containing protein n=1 Tax=Ancylostoma ceylanicum TaxID=53326 RepID=A0A016T0V9_9BILA|nr:hypothetical protein Y032_0149g2715 [Ancylostoma ceylanicum]